MINFLLGMLLIMSLSGCESHHSDPPQQDPLILRPGRGLEECPPERKDPPERGYR